MKRRLDAIGLQYLVGGVLVGLGSIAAGLVLPEDLLLLRLALVLGGLAAVALGCWGAADDVVESLVERVAKHSQAGQSVRELQRTAIREVIAGIESAMAAAEYDREHGAVDSEIEARTAAAVVGGRLHEVDNERARQSALMWRSKFDEIPKGWKRQVEYSSKPPGYPEQAWLELKAAANHATAALGDALRGLNVSTGEGRGSSKPG